MDRREARDEARKDRKMNPREIIRVALRALARNKLRTVLTMLGIIIGVGAVICTVAIGQGASAQVQAQIQSLGDNIIMVFAGSVNTGGVRMGNGANKTLTDDDAQAILQHVPNIMMVSPIVGSSVQVVNGNQNWLTRATGASADITQIRNWPIVSGSMFSERDVDMASNSGSPTPERICATWRSTTSAYDYYDVSTMPKRSAVRS